jgi:hypothetical protein
MKKGLLDPSLNNLISFYYLKAKTYLFYEKLTHLRYESTKMFLNLGNNFLFVIILVALFISFRLLGFLF